MTGEQRRRLLNLAAMLEAAPDRGRDGARRLGLSDVDKIHAYVVGWLAAACRIAAQEIREIVAGNGGDADARAS